MKKILGISLVAVLAVSPMMAMAEGELGSAVTIAGTVAESGNAFTTQSYVKGAYNVVEGDLANVNAAVTKLNADDTTNGSVLKAIKDNAANATYTANGEYAAGSIGAAIQSAISGNATAGAALQKTNSGAFNVLVDDTTIGIDATGNTLEVKDGSIGTTQLAPGVVTSLGKADTAVQPGALATVATTGNASDLTTDPSHEFVTAQQKTDWQAAADAVSNASTGLASKQDQLTNGTNNISSTVKTAIATGATGDEASDTALLTESAIYTAIQAAKTAATYDDTALDARVSANETAIATNDRRLIPVATGWGGASSADTTSTVQLNTLSLAPAE